MISVTETLALGSEIFCLFARKATIVFSNGNPLFEGVNVRNRIAH